VSIDRVAAALLIGLPVGFNVFFFLLARLFDYPSVLRSPAGLILSRFLAGGLRLKLVWYGFMLTAVLRADRYRASKPARDFPFVGGRRAQRGYFDDRAQPPLAAAAGRAAGRAVRLPDRDRDDRGNPHPHRRDARACLRRIARGDTFGERAPGRAHSRMRVA
jgi:hypothetical protein